VRDQLLTNKTNSPRNTKHFYLFQNVIYCGKCRHKMYIKIIGDLHYYHCMSNTYKHYDKCDNRVISAKIVDDVVWGYVKNKTNLKRAALKIETYDEVKEDNTIEQKEKLFKQREKVLSWLANNLISDTEAEKQLINIKDRLELLSIPPKIKPKKVNIDSILEIISHARTSEEMKKAVADTISKVYILRLDKGRKTPELQIDIELL